jgi:hypothetical protein
MSVFTRFIVSMIMRRYAHSTFTHETHPSDLTETKCTSERDDLLLFHLEGVRVIMTAWQSMA